MKVLPLSGSQNTTARGQGCGGCTQEVGALGGGGGILSPLPFIRGRSDCWLWQGKVEEWDTEMVSPCLLP